jgi:hypothetical protein
VAGCAVDGCGVDGWAAPLVAVPVAGAADRWHAEPTASVKTSKGNSRFIKFSSAARWHRKRGIITSEVSCRAWVCLFRFGWRLGLVLFAPRIGLRARDDSRKVRILFSREPFQLDGGL